MARDEKRLTLLEHLEELRRRLIWSLLAVALATAFSFAFAGTVFDLLKSRAEGVQLIRTTMTEMIGVYMKVSLITGVVLASPMLLYHAVMFVAPALTPQEKRYLFFLLPGTMVSFLVGVAFAYFVLLPPALSFLLSFGAEIATPLIKVGDYISLVAWLLFWIGLAFETPLVLFFLALIGVVSPEFLARQRRFAVLGAFILGAMITPTFDPVNQTLVALPIVILYEAGVWLAKLAWRWRHRERPAPLPGWSPGPTESR